MLDFICESQLQGQRPTLWWTKLHDIDIMRGVHKYGFSNFT